MSAARFGGRQIRRGDIVAPFVMQVGQIRLSLSLDFEGDQADLSKPYNAVEWSDYPVSASGNARTRERIRCSCLSDTLASACGSRASTTANPRASA